MRDLYEAIEQLSVLLSLRIQNIVRKRGWAGQPKTSRFEVRSPEDRAHYPTQVTISMSLGHVVSFTPAEQPSEDGQSWHIKIQRSDGVMRRSFSDGIYVRKVENGYQLFVRGEVLSEALCKTVFDDLSSGGLSGHSMTIGKAFKSRFGSIPAEVYEILCAAQHLEQLEQMHEAVLTEVTQLDVETALGKLSKWTPDNT